MSKTELLNSLDLPSGLKSLSIDELNLLCEEIRYEIIKTVSVNGGHLASNLGVVELTVALHKVFNLPDDKIIWDVGHQCYTHKILTGRLDRLHTIRKEGGISGFPKRSESEYDSFDVGHSSTSISAAFGMACANTICGKANNVIAVIGDGALSGGLAYEGLNNAGRFKKNFIVILNDNKMSISRNVGSMSKYLTGIRTKSAYVKTKTNLDKFLIKAPVIGKSTKQVLFKAKKVLKSILYDNTLFEDMGFQYYGPVDGHNLQELIHVLNFAKDFKGPILIHVLTKKGKGYEFAEKKPNDYHGVTPFNVNIGKEPNSSKTFSSVFSDTLCELAEKDDKICAITAAMKTGTGLSKFCRKFKDRFFDVGIAEEHAVTFAGGLAVSGLIPVFAVYSTFLQRSYDQLIHDIALQNLKLVLAIDRAGIVGEDGETHQGCFDIPMLNSIPGVEIYSPSYFEEMKSSLYNAIYNCRKIAAVRYPRGTELYKPPYYKNSNKAFDIYGTGKIAIITYGRLFSFAAKASDNLKNFGINVMLIKLNRIRPISQFVIKEILKKRVSHVFFFEECMSIGGIGEIFSYMLYKERYKGKFTLKAINDKFIPQASVDSILNKLELNDKKMQNIIMTECKI